MKISPDAITECVDRVRMSEPCMALLTDTDRVRLLAAFGYVLYRSPDIDPQGLDLLLRLSDPEARVWVQATPS